MSFNDLSPDQIANIENAWRKYGLRNKVIAATGMSRRMCCKYMPTDVIRKKQHLSAQRRAAIEQAWREHGTAVEVMRVAKCGMVTALRCRPDDVPEPTGERKPWSQAWREEFERRWSELDPNQVVTRLARFLAGVRNDCQTDR